MVNSMEKPPSLTQQENQEQVYGRREREKAGQELIMTFQEKIQSQQIIKVM
jgi:hypothetical protein